VPWSARTRRARASLVGVAALGLAAAAAAIVGTSEGSPPAGDCRSSKAHCLFVDVASVGGKCSDSRSVSEARSPDKPWCSLKHAVGAAPSASNVAVRQGSYPWLTVKGVERRKAVTLGNYPGERVQLAGFEVEGSRGLRLRGFDVASTTGQSSVVGSRRISIVDSDFSRQGLVLRAVRDTTIAHNRIHDLLRPPGPEGFNGYGIWANGSLGGGPTGGIDRLLIRGNTFRNIPNDGVQIGGGSDLVRRVTIVGNDFGFVRRAVEGDHPDPIQVIGGRDIVIRSNRFHDSEDAIIVKDDVTTGLVVENNLMVGWSGGCIQAQLWNTPGARVVHNTIWRSSCVGLRLAYDPSVGPAPTGIVVRRNIVDSYADDGLVADQDYNVILHGPRRGPHDSARRPQFGAGFKPLGGAARLKAGSSLR
jgi:Right handed beta helix region